MTGRAAGHGPLTRAVPIACVIVAAVLALAAAAKPKNPAPRSGAAAAAVPVRPAAPPVNLHQFARKHGLDAEWLEKGRRLRLHDRTRSLVFAADKREIEFNGIRVFMGDPAVPARNALNISGLDRDRLVLPILAPQALPPRLPPRVVVLDPGHGGRDTGTQNKELKLEEKVLTLDMARRLKSLLEARGFVVVLTRGDDTYVALPDRAARAAAAKADLFISIHFNAADPATVRGLETYTVTPQFQRSTGSDNGRAEDGVAVPGNKLDGWNAFLGYTMHRQLKTALGLADRGLKRARFQVLREAQAPAVLIECGYLSNTSEARLIANADYRQKLAAAMADGVAAYRQVSINLARARAAKSSGH